MSEKISDIDKKISEEAAIFKEMLDKESEERQLESDLLKQVIAEEAKNLKQDLEDKTSSIQNDLGSVKDDLQSTKDQGIEELKNMIVEEKEERQKEAEMIHDHLSTKIQDCSTLTQDLNDTLNHENSRYVDIKILIQCRKSKKIVLKSLVQNRLHQTLVLITTENFSNFLNDY